jgi:divalent metal cation (Fe/Co/Zn/Cd) transporter
VMPLRPGLPSPLLGAGPHACCSRKVSTSRSRGTLFFVRTHRPSMFASTSTSSTSTTLSPRQFTRIYLTTRGAAPSSRRSSSSPSFLALNEPRLAAHRRLAPLCPLVLQGGSQSSKFSMGAPRKARDTRRDKQVVEEDDHDHHDHSHSHSHSHSPFGHHHHHHDNTFLTSANKSDPGVRITRIGLVSNLGMAIAKFIGGWAFNSKAMTADAWHSIADLASDILTLATVSWSLRPPTDRFPMGFGKVESLGALGVSGMLLTGGLYMGWESAISLYAHFNPEMAHDVLAHMGHGHGHSHSHAHGAAALVGIPSLHAAWLAAGTIALKEWLYRATMAVARERKSSVLASNAVHHRIDSLTGIVTLVAIVGANALESAAWLDPVGGLLISLMVVNAGATNTLSALYELIDQSIDDDIKKSVRKQVQKALANVSEGHQAELREVGGTKSGQNYLVELEMSVPGAWTINDIKDVEDAVRSQVGAAVRGVKRVKVRFVSNDATTDRKFDEFVSSRSGSPESDDGSSHDGNSHSHGRDDSPR